MRALVDAHLGNVERARATVDSRLQGVEEKPMTVPPYLRALGFLELSLGDAAGAARHLSRTVELAESFGIREPGVYRVHADLIEALLGTGDLERAEAVLCEREARGRASRVGWSLATGARCRGLLLAARGSLEAAERSLAEALVEHDRLPLPFERGRTLLALGLLQRRRNERRRVQETLQQALDTFEELGAPLWAARARRELRPLGGRPTSHTTLTPSEQRVAELAATGLTNRQVAATLFISPKTVESALAQAYRKLKIRSRAELGAHVRSQADRRANSSRSRERAGGYLGKHPVPSGGSRLRSVLCESIEAKAPRRDELHGRVLLARRHTAAAPGCRAPARAG